MILKELDDHQRDLKILNNFLDNPKIPQNIKNQITLEIKKIHAGLKAQKQAAYEMEFALKDKEGTIILHDLRFEVEGRVAQIDHLIINRLFEVYVCESKNFSEGVSINDNLEFTAFYNNKPYGINSPIEQNNKHIAVVKSIFDKNMVESPTRLGLKIKPLVYSAILVSNNARITRPKKEIKEIESIMKNENFINFYRAEKRSSLYVLVDATKIIYAQSALKIAKQLLALNRPIKFNWVDKFQVEKYLPTIELVTSYVPTDLKLQKLVEPTESKNEKPVKKFFCATCASELDNSVVFWCRKNKEKFNSLLLCREHQPK